MLNSIGDEVDINHTNFQKVRMIMQDHEQYIVESCVLTIEMAQYVNALIKENAQKGLIIGSFVRECQVQSEVLRQQLEGQQVLAEVLKVLMIAGQPREQTQLQQCITRTGQTTTEVDDSRGTDTNLQNAPSPNSGPPDTGAFGSMTEVSQVPTSMEIVRQF